MDGDTWKTLENAITFPGIPMPISSQVSLLGSLRIFVDAPLSDLLILLQEKEDVLVLHDLAVGAQQRKYGSPYRVFTLSLVSLTGCLLSFSGEALFGHMVQVQYPSADSNFDSRSITLELSGHPAGQIRKS